MDYSLWLMSVLYMIAGVNHFINPKFYLRIIPGWIPYHSAVNYGSGLAEIVLGVMLLFSTTQSLAAWGIIVLLILIFPANIKMSIDFYKKNHKLFWITIVRLPLQFVLIWWAWVFTN